MGIGARVTLDIGGRLTPGFVPLEVAGVVTAISDGRFVIGGPFCAGEETSLGRTAVLVVDDRLSLMLTSKPGFTHDPATFASQGINVSTQDFVVVKSGYHYKLNFARVGTPLAVATRGSATTPPVCFIGQEADSGRSTNSLTRRSGPLCMANHSRCRLLERT
ncbi:MAG: hypothetical protein EOS79_20775 [Mesorhizobium sp.]|nr:MAG: hypothetical protein EOS79_20775 [Mesorhizobium sp.]